MQGSQNLGFLGDLALLPRAGDLEWSGPSSISYPSSSLSEVFIFSFSLPAAEMSLHL